MDRRKFLAAVVGGGSVAISGCFGYELIESDELDRLEGRIDELENTLDDKRDRIDSLERDLDDKTEYVTDLEEENDDLTVELQQTSEEVADLEADLSQARAEIDDLEAAKSTKQSEIASLEDDIEQLEDRIADLTGEAEFDDDEIDAAVDVAHEHRDAVSFIATSQSAATAFHIGDGIYTTVEHAVAPTFALFDDHLETFDGETTSYDREQTDADLDLRTVSADELDAVVDVGTHARPDGGDVVVSIGHPIHVGMWVIAVGRFDRFRDGSNFEEAIADLPAQSRSSGSPVFDTDGQFVGMVLAAQNFGNREDRPDDPLFSFAEYEPQTVCLPGKTVADRLSSWNYSV